MTDHITIRIGQEAPLMSLTGQRRSVCYLLVHETKRALLIAAVENMDGICQAVNEAEDANVIQIPSWLWAKKEPAKSMGAFR